MPIKSFHVLTLYRYLLNVEKLRVKLATVQSAFQIYKINLEKETEDKFNEKVGELRQQLRAKIDRESEVISKCSLFLNFANLKLILNHKICSLALC